ncbi:MAG: methylmalonyl Co-A mutase-associated GTPase MeaB [Chloroflexota bacterium]
MTLVDSVLKGDRLALARLLTHVENNTVDGRTALRLLFPRTGTAHLIGVTGAPGTGKSSLVNRLALHFRGKNKRVAIAAVDPSSPFTGGAVLGDRVRMKDLSSDPDIFIRSMASRGALGGLARSTAGIVQVFDAAGYDMILIETVGAGQGEVDIVRLAHTTLVVEAPGLGDDIQAIKAGILEIADILVVNKADRPGVENTEKALRSVLELAHPTPRTHVHHGQALTPDVAVETSAEGWNIPILRTVSTDGQGIAELAEQIERHSNYLRASGDWSRREQRRLASELDAILRETLLHQFHAGLPEGRYNEVVRQVIDKQLSPDEAAQDLIDGGTPTPAGGRGSRRAR